MKISKELLKKLGEEIYDKLPKYQEEIDVAEYQIQITGISVALKDHLFIPIEEDQ